MAIGDELMRSLMDRMSGGIDDLDDAEEKVREAAAQMHRLEDEQRRNEARRIAAALSTPDGAWLLDWLIANTLLRPESAEEATATTAEAYLLARRVRDGENRIVNKLREAIDLARGDITEGKS